MLQDVRYALSALRSSPGFAATAILSLALGIGANTAIFSLINAVILKTLPVSHPEQLVELVMKTEDGTSFTNPIWEQVRDRQDVFSGAFAYSPIRLNLAAGGEVRNASTSWVSGDFFSTLGVHPLLGRTFTAADDQRGCPAIAVLSSRLLAEGIWGRGRCLRAAVDAQTAIRFGSSVSLRPDSTASKLAKRLRSICLFARKGLSFVKTPHSISAANWWLWIFARLKPGIGEQQALARMNTLAPQIFAATMPSGFSARRAEIPSEPAV